MEVTHHVETPAGTFRCVIDSASATFLQRQDVVDKVLEWFGKCGFDCASTFVKVQMSSAADSNSVSINLIPMKCVQFQTVKPVETSANEGDSGFGELVSSTPFDSPVRKKYRPHYNIDTDVVKRLDSLSPFKETQSVESDQPTATHCVKIGGLQEVFHEDHLEMFLNRNAWKYGLVEQPLKAVKSVFAYDPAAKCCQVEFNSADVALSFLRRCPWIYDEEEIDMKAINKETDRTKTTCVKIGGLQEVFHEDHLERFLNRNAWKYGLVEQPLKAVKSVFAYDPAQKCCQVEFNSADLASSFLKFSPWIYDEEEIDMKPDNSKQSVSNSENREENEIDIDLAPELNEVQDSDEEVVLPGNASFRTDWPTICSLKLILYCKKYKELILSGATRFRSKGYSKVHKAMLRENLFYTLPVIRKQWRGMLTAHEGGTCEFQDHISVIKGIKLDKYSPTLEEAIQHAASQPHALQTSSKKSASKQNNKYHKGVLILDDCLVVDNSAKFTRESDLLLIAEYKKNKEWFDDDKHRAEEVYAKILKVFHSMGYHRLTASDLSTRMAYLAHQFKCKYDAILNLTGTSAEARKWPYYIPMGLILEESAVCKPQKILSVGAQHIYQTRPAKPKPFAAGNSYKAQKVDIAANLLQEVKDISLLVKQSLSPT